jgi:hypothetical protein
MSGSNKRATPRRPDLPRGEPGSGRPSRARSAELASARHRADATKVAVACSGALVFVAAMGLARHSFASRPKAPARALGASQKFLNVIRQNQLNAGVVAPAQAPPGAATAVS